MAAAQWLILAIIGTPLLILARDAYNRRHRPKAIYDPAKGDPNRGIPPGTPFEALPEDWTCPDCGATKDMFEKV